MLFVAAPDRKCSPPFRGGLRPQHSEKRKRGITSPIYPYPAQSGILFFIIHHEICKLLICIRADTMMKDKK